MSTVHEPQFRIREAARTGKTAEAIRRAISAAAEGRSVLFSCWSHDHARLIFDKIISQLDLVNGRFSVSDVQFKIRFLETKGLIYLVSKHSAESTMRGYHVDLEIEAL